MLNMGLAVLIVCFNILIRVASIWIINNVGLKTKSEVVSATMSAIFEIQCLNIGFMLLLVNSNMKYAPEPFNYLPFRQQYVDLTSSWYRYFSPDILISMISLAVFPQLDFIISYLTSKVLRIIDKGYFNRPFCRNKNKTKCKTKKQYETLYAGPKYEMHFNYSCIMTQIYISFMYGMIMPILFPMTLFGIINMYFVERLLLAYYYKQPPKYDEKLQKTVQDKLFFAPILMYLIGYWGMSNR